jgi:hypothetical protein
VKRSRWALVVVVATALGGCRAILGIEDLRLADGGAAAAREGGTDAGTEGGADSGTLDVASEASTDEAGSLCVDASFEGGPTTQRAQCLNNCITTAGAVAADFFIGDGGQIKQCICSNCPGACHDFCCSDTRSEPQCDDCATSALIQFGPTPAPCMGIACGSTACKSLAGCLSQCP